MKKLFTLLALLTIAVTQMWAGDATTIFSMTSVTGPTDDVAKGATLDVTATFVGGSAQVHNGKAKAASMYKSSGNFLNLGGSDGSYVAITLTGNTILEGDIIAVTTGESSANAKISATASKNDAAVKAVPYTVVAEDAIVGKSTIYIFKNGDGIKTISSITITRQPKVTHSVAYNLGEGTSATGAPTQADVAEGAKFTVANAPTDLVAPTGQEFKCWNDGTNDYNAGAEYTMGTSNVTLTAVYQAETVKYSVTYALNGGSGDAPTQASIAEGTKFTVASAEGITAPEGKRFSTWNDGSADYAPGAEYTMGTDPVTLTAQYVDIYAVTKATPANGSIEVSAETAAAGEKITLTATPDFRYALSVWNVYKTGEPATTVTVTDNEFTMPAYAVTVDATFAADTKKQVLYVTSDGTVNSGDDLYAALSEDYTVTKAAWNATTVTVTDFDLVVLHESIGGKNTGNLVEGAMGANVPVLNTKSYFYSDGKNNNNRWSWGLPNAGGTVNGCTQNAAYSNIASHPIFDGVTVSDGFVQVVGTAAEKAMQPVGTITEGKEGYVLATSPNASSGKGAAIHELTAAERGVASAKYIMISVSNASLNDLTANGQLLFKNAAAYLMSDEAWTPTLATTNITLNAKGYGTYSKANDFTFSGAKAYKMALDESAKTITGTEVTGKIVAGEGILFRGEAGATVTITGATWATALEGNNLKGTTKADGTKAVKPEFCYTLSGDTFKKFTGTAFNDNKAYFEASQDLKGQSFEIIFDGEATAISFVVEDDANVAAAPVKTIKNGQLFIGNYNVAGARIK